MADMGGIIVWMGWQSIRIVGASACVIFILHQKIQKMAKWLCVCVCVCSLSVYELSEQRVKNTEHEVSYIRY